jgi:uncharacterized protein YeeX (DUF496 family)
MKKFILLLVIIINLLANNINDKNSTHKIIIGYKTNFIDRINYFIPDFLKISTEKSFINIKLYEDTLIQKTPSASIGINIKLPEFFVKKTSKKSKNNKITTTSTTTIKLRPMLRLRKKRIFFLQNIIEYKKNYLNNEYGVANTINYYPIEGYYEESINFAYFKHLKYTYGTNLNISTNKDDFPQKNYSLNFSISNLKKKYITSFGYTIGGSSTENPFIYYHKTYINFRKALFNKKYIFLDITPYILFSKDYHYKLKPAIYSSINIKF